MAIRRTLFVASLIASLGRLGPSMDARGRAATRTAAGREAAVALSASIGCGGTRRTLVSAVARGGVRDSIASRQPVGARCRAHRIFGSPDGGSLIG